MSDFSPARSVAITGGTVLTEAGFERRDLAISQGRVAAEDARDGDTIDARGLLVLPGIVDIHGDGFERQIQPRPGVAFPVPLALADTERQLLANGITTAFHAVTLSWEPGLRSAATWRALLDALAARRWDCDMRVHMRWEACNLGALAMAEADIAAGRVALVSFNDHTPAIHRALGDPGKIERYSTRASLSAAAFRAVADGIVAPAGEVDAGNARIAAAAGAAGIAMASHDDETVAVREGWRARGASICEFPMAETVGRAARAAGEAVVMGSPNVVRGTSHLGWASAAAMAEAGICDVLCSDYFYPCLLHAPFVLASRGSIDLAAAWRLVSSNPAHAARLHDRGTLEPGRRGDVILVDHRSGTPVLRAVLAGGRVVWIDAALAR